MAPVRHDGGFLAQRLIIFSMSRVLRAAYEDQRVQDKLKALPQYTALVPRSQYGNKLKTMAILHMMTGIKPESFEDYEGFHARLEEDATKDFFLDPLKYSPTVVFTSSDGGDGAVRPIIYAHSPYDDRENYLLLEYYTDVASGAKGLIGKSMNTAKLKQGFLWSARLTFAKTRAENVPPLLPRSGVKLDTQGFFVPV
jgi:hypothetical protein